MKTGIILGVLLAFFAIGSPALAQRWGGGETLDRILPQIRAHHPGRLSDAEPFVGDDGDTHYRIKWMTPEGRIIYFDADGRSGRWSPARGEDPRDGGYWRPAPDAGRGYYGDDGYDRPDNAGRSRPWPGPGGGRNWNGWPQGRPAWPAGRGRVFSGAGQRGWNGGRRGSQYFGGH